MKSTATFYVYLLFRLNGIPCYVGKGKGDRWARHEGRAKHKNRHLGSIIDQARAAGKELPKIKVCEDMNEEAAFELERLLIGCIGRGNYGPLVNLTDGGDGPSGYKPSAELIARQTAARKGKLHPPGSNERRSAGLKGKPKTPEHAAAAGAGQRGKTKSFGWWSNEEGRAKQKANNHGRGNNPHSHETVLKIKQSRFQQEARIAVKTSSTWANQNSVRFPQLMEA